MSCRGRFHFKIFTSALFAEASREIIAAAAEQDHNDDDNKPPVVI
jgi:hypothetical protein